MATLDLTIYYHKHSFILFSQINSVAFNATYRSYTNTMFVALKLDMVLWLVWAQGSQKKFIDSALIWIPSFRTWNI